MTSPLFIPHVPRYLVLFHELSIEPRPQIYLPFPGSTDRMGLADWVAAVFGDEVREIYECRECGTNLASEEEDCPYCGPTDVVQIELPG